MSETEESQTQKENMTLRTKEVVPCKEDVNNKEQTVVFAVLNATHDKLEEELLTHVANSKAMFKSQQKEDPELTFEEKRAIAAKSLDKSHCLFLSKFGHYLKVEHLEYFSKSKDYEIVYHVNRLRRYFNNSTRHVDVRNRRYEALKTLIEKGEYFSECEMMKRNPLLYEHLIGQYLTEKEKKARDSIDIRNTNYVDVLMETIERNKAEKHLKSQQEEEEAVQEESDSDDDDDDSSRDSITSQRTNSSKHSHSHWGGNLNNKTDNNYKYSDKRLQKRKMGHKIPSEELQLLKQEFVTNMYQSFLDGKDRDFDYSTVDNNEAYDNVDLRDQDEEEKYFDSEEPETILPHNECNNENESEDELEAYMKTLKEQTPTNPLSLDNQS